MDRLSFPAAAPGRAGARLRLPSLVSILCRGQAMLFPHRRDRHAAPTVPKSANGFNRLDLRLRGTPEGPGAGSPGLDAAPPGPSVTEGLHRGGGGGLDRRAVGGGQGAVPTDPVRRAHLDPGPGRLEPQPELPPEPGHAALGIPAEILEPQDRIAVAEHRLGMALHPEIALGPEPRPVGGRARAPGHMALILPAVARERHVAPVAHHMDEAQPGHERHREGQQEHAARVLPAPEGLARMEGQMLPQRRAPEGQIGLLGPAALEQPRAARRQRLDRRDQRERISGLVPRAPEIAARRPQELARHPRARAAACAENEGRGLGKVPVHRIVLLPKGPSFPAGPGELKAHSGLAAAGDPPARARGRREAGPMAAPPADLNPARAWHKGGTEARETAMTETPTIVTIGDIAIGGGHPIALITGPCQLESLDHARMMAERIAEACAPTGTKFIFKASYDKANRSSLSTARGLGMEKGLEILGRIREEFGVPVLTDVHEPGHCATAAEVCDVLQIPAFLCRQTDLLLAAGETGRAVNVKKGQFLAPWDMKNVADKVASTGNRRILLCERGTSFGYNTLVTDFRGLPTMAATGWPVVFDATHSVQQPGGLGGSSGGQREFAPVLARAACAVGVSALFIETHEDPDRAPSDGPNMIPVDRMGRLIADLCAFDALAKSLA
ncbi:2-dehydro-3-deoxyphosphooctonate aldolase (plasmid) [Cereibacter sphaeroides KD131]|nr:2-dehydro-3-deoxyphosphooctonate aldolase [Cereibacter sphaeroides KD131]